MPASQQTDMLVYENFSHKWSKVNPNYNKQYCNIYLVRLKQMEELLHKRIEQKWGNTYPIYKLHKLAEQKYVKCVVIGTLFKNQKLKPSVLKQLAEGNQLVPQPIVSHFTDESDELFLEDELQRYLITGCLKPDNLVTGITLALLGIGDEKGRFEVDDYLFSEFREQVERPLLLKSALVVFISGLDLINSATFLMKLQLFVCWLSGILDGGDDFKNEEIQRVIITGNCIRNQPEKVKPSISMLSKLPESKETFEAVAQFDKLLFQLCQLAIVDVMPGPNDPSNNVLPQKPMHYCMFPESSIYKSANQVTNPYYCSIGGVRIMGTSGQPVHDVMRNSEISDPLEVLECCLKWNHMAPSAPDTLGCYPFYDNDLFIFDDCPHVFFAGNQNEFSTKECQGQEGQNVRLISIPEFNSTFQACILDLKNLNCTSINF